MAPKDFFMSYIIALILVCTIQRPLDLTILTSNRLVTLCKDLQIVNYEQATLHHKIMIVLGKISKFPSKTILLSA